MTSNHWVAGHESHYSDTLLAARRRCLIHYPHGSGASPLAKMILQPIMLAVVLTLTLEVNSTLTCLGERRELPQWGPGRAPAET